MAIGKATAVWIFLVCTALPALGQQMPNSTGDGRAAKAKLMSELWAKRLGGEGGVDAKAQSLLTNPPEGSAAAVAKALSQMREKEWHVRAQLGELERRLRKVLEEQLQPLLAKSTGPRPPSPPPAIAQPPVRPAAERARQQREEPSGSTASGQGMQGARSLVATPIQCGQPGIEALPLPDRRGLYRRVLTAPGAVLRERPDPRASGTPLPLFTIRYVSAEQGAWLCVGPKLDDAGRGWVAVDHTRPWEHMLVVRFVEKGARRRVVFFREAEPLVSLIEEPDATDLARRIYEELADGRVPEGVIGVEPQTAVDEARFPYLLPIIDWKEAETFDGSPVRVVRVAAAARKPGAARASGPERGSDVPTPGSFTVGIAFVIDTTSSMGPYINEVRRFLAEFQQLARRSKIGDRVRFAIVGYRDNTAPDPRIGYVSKVFLDFTSPLSDKVLDRALAIEPAKVPTRDWREDAVAGMWTALQELSWQELDARILVLVTDAGAREPGDPLATTDYGIEAIRALANQRNVAIVAVHMRTPEAERAKDVDRAERQYRKLATTGDRNLRKYLGLEGNTVESFRVQLARTARELMAALERVANGAPPHTTADAGGTGTAELSSLLLHEIFARSMLEVLGRETGTALPDFLEGWASDRDLVQPELEALTVAVLLDRKELDDLAQRLDAIVRTVREGGTAEEFWRKVTLLSGEKQIDPDAVRRIGDLLPAFLEMLPYRSKFLSIDRAMWDAMKQTDKLNLVNEVAEKVKIYRAVIAEPEGWIRVDPDDRSGDLYPLELRHLP